LHSDILLKVENLKTQFFTSHGVVKAVDGVSLRLNRGEILGLVGESGSGKTVASLSILGLVPKPAGKIVQGSIIFKGRDLLSITEKQMRKLRGSQITMIPQDPMTSLNPVFRIGKQLAEPLALHQRLKGAKLWGEVAGALDMVGIPSPRQRLRQFPHQFSGGMKQRAMIAMCLSCRPDLIIADEPTTALDVTIQAQILELLKRLQSRTQTAIIFITHDLGVVAGLCQKVAVMYAGVIVEQGAVTDIFKRAKHPYTQGLIASVPKLGTKRKRLFVIEGQPPSLLNKPRGCRFYPRCSRRTNACLESEPVMEAAGEGHLVRCHRWREL
jgi:oligopeptide/dipeptide ABC transporter ATP-binding protein